MFDSAILDVAIGLAFVLLLVSLLVSAVCEMLAGWLKWRSANLRDGLEHLLQSQEARNQVYNHPLIKGLTKVNAKGAQWNGGRNGPSYIPSRTFALALIDVLRKPHRFADDVLGRLQLAVTEATNDPAKIFKSLDELVTNISAEAVPETVKRQLAELKARVDPALTPEIAGQLKQRILGLLPEQERARVGQELSRRLDEHTVGVKTIRQLRGGLAEAITKLEAGHPELATAVLRSGIEDALRQFNLDSPEAAIREIETFARSAAKRWLEEAEASMQSTVEALRPLLQDAAENVEQFRENIEIWFNDGMDRISGWYKRHVAVAQTVIALGLAIAMNVDALQIIRTLWREPTIRQSVVAQATKFAENPSPALTPPAAETPGTDVAGKRLTHACRRRCSVKARSVRRTSRSPMSRRIRCRCVVEPVSPNLLFGEALEKVDNRRLEVKLKAGAKEVPIFVRGGPVGAQSLERFKVTAAGSRCLPRWSSGPRPGRNSSACSRTSARSACRSSGCPVPAPGTTDHGGWPDLVFGDRRPQGRGVLVRPDRRADDHVVRMAHTAAAASLGAPFWFDMLKKVVSVRSSGKAPEEKPVSPKEVSPAD